MANEARVNIQTQVKISTLRAVPARLPQMQSSPIRVSFRGAFLFSATLAFIAGIYLVWLWQPDRQVRLHTAHLIRQLEKRNWSAAQYFIAADYHDDWGDDRERLLERMREVLRYARAIQIISSDPQTQIERRHALWTAKVQITGDGEVVALIKERINTLSAPFELAWHRQSDKPWDWKLVRASNRELIIGAEEY